MLQGEFAYLIETSTEGEKNPPADVVADTLIEGDMREKEREGLEIQPHMTAEMIFLRFEGENVCRFFFLESFYQCSEFFYLM